MAFVTWMYCLVITCAEPTSTPPAIVLPNTLVPDPSFGVACDLDGFWYNNLGSEMYLKTTSDGYLKGEYRTAVEYSYGSAGDGPSYVTGRTSHDGTLLGFTVLWEGYNGTSMTSWNGVCEICDGETILKTQWFLHYSGEHGCMDSYSRNGSDIFTRGEQAPGPRYEHKTHNPRDFRERLRMLERNGEN